tara:strand:+ start:6517 stop:7422 length:906 start_codon:yes stop_codon:yes gene_type:complete
VPNKSRSRLATAAIIAGRALAIALIASTTAAGAGIASAVPQPDREITADISAPYTVEALLEEFTAPQQTLDELEASIAKAAPKTPKIIDLHDAAADKIEAAREAIESPDVVRLGVFGTMMQDADIEAIETRVIQQVEEATAGAVESVADWKAEVKAENARIAEAKAEARRVAAAKAAAAAAAASNSSGGYSGWSYAATSNESYAQRVARIAASLPFHVSYSIDNGCTDAAALACYFPSNDRLLITTYMGSSPDCTIRNALAHEWRHRQQNYSGQIQISGGQITNVAWLESDAYAFGNGYGC